MTLPPEPDLYQEGVDLPLVSRILGHASMETAKIYAKPSMEALLEAMAAVAPATEAERPIWKGGRGGDGKAVRP